MFEAAYRILCLASFHFVLSLSLSVNLAVFTVVRRFLRTLSLPCMLWDSF